MHSTLRYEELPNAREEIGKSYFVSQKFNQSMCCMKVPVYVSVSVSVDLSPNMRGRPFEGVDAKLFHTNHKIIQNDSDGTLLFQSPCS